MKSRFFCAAAAAVLLVFFVFVGQTALCRTATGLADEADEICRALSDDARAEEMLRYGVKLYVDMLNYRDKLSAGSGLLTSSTVTYSFGAYPYASFFFFHLWESAFGENVAGRWQQMCDFPNWFDYAAIDLDENCRFLSYGIGDLMHKKNRFAAFEIYTHLAQTVHFYGQIRPQRMARTWELLKRIPANYAKIWDM